MRNAVLDDARAVHAIGRRGVIPNVLCARASAGDAVDRLPKVDRKILCS
jgi:hypothetical protein